MTIQVYSEKNDFQALLENIFSRTVEGEAGLGQLKSKAWDSFLKLGLPSRRDEVFRYIPLKKLFLQKFQQGQEVPLSSEQIKPFILPECVDSVIVFVNGFFQKEMSCLEGVSSKIGLHSLEDALLMFGGFFNNQWQKSLEEEKDPFASMNAALHPRGAFLYIPPKTIVEKPIQILYITVGDDPLLTMPRLHVFSGSQSDCQLVTTRGFLSPSTSFDAGVINLHLEEDAHLKHYHDSALDRDKTWQFCAYRAVLKRGSVLKTIDITDGSETIRNDYRISLIGEGAESLLNGLWMLKDKREAHFHLLIDHQAPNCHSMQLFKGALTDFSRSSFEGKILVRQKAQKTDAFQLNNNLLLSERAHADSKPNLEIFADDVKASHGATVGQLDFEQLFYMLARGFSSDLAKNLLVYGYCKEILEMIPLPSLYAKMQGLALSFLMKK